MGPLTKVIAKYSLALAMLLTSSLASAHFFSESPTSCKAPKKPLKFVTELDEQLFNQEVDLYRGCLDKFVTRQNEAMDKHKAGAEKAAQAWRTYAEQVLELKFKDETEDDEESSQSPAEEVSPTAPETAE